MKREAIIISRRLRKEQTHAEKILWERLRNRKFMNEKFLRQHPVFFQVEGLQRFFVADFYCAEKKLAIEIDGGIHSRQCAYDRYRESIIQALGIEVVRVSNRMVEEDANRFLNEVLAPFLVK
jgi:very-short-patch-repair endonuclease